MNETTFKPKKSRSGYTIPPRVVLPLTREELKVEYYTGKTQQELATKYNCSLSFICTELRKVQTVTRDPRDTSRKYQINDTFFEKIDTEEKAYFYGLLLADGYNNQTKHAVNLSLGIEDVAILETFKSLIGYEKPLYLLQRAKKNPNWSDAYTLSITSYKVSEDLAKWGITQAKTFKTVYPEWLDEILVPHFIRGYFDGDGCIYVGKVPSFHLEGTRELLTRVQEVLIQALGLKKNKFQKRHKQREDNIISLIYSGYKNLRVIREYLYSNATVYLERKSEKFKLICPDLERSKFEIRLTQGNTLEI